MAKADRYTLTSFRGLAAQPESGVKRYDSFRVNPLILQVEEGFNLRLVGDEEGRLHVESIKSSIRLFITRNDPANRVWEGSLKEVFPALVVRLTEDGEILVVDGEHRLVAIRELIADEGFDIHYVDVEASKADAADRVVMMMRSSESRHLTPIDRSDGLVRLADDFGWNFPKIAEHVGMTTQRVEQLILLGRAHEDIQKAVRSKLITADSAIEIIRAHRAKPEEGVAVVAALVKAKIANSEARPVGKGQTRASIPRKAQDAVFSAFAKSNRELGEKIDALGNQENWEEIQVDVKLPAGIVKLLLEIQAKNGSAMTTPED